MTRTRCAEQGLALASVLVAGTLVTATVAIALNLAGQRAHHAGLQSRRERSFHIAEAGVAVAYEKLGADLPFTDDQGRTQRASELVAGDPRRDTLSETIAVEPGRSVTVTVKRVSTTPSRYNVTASSDM